MYRNAPVVVHGAILRDIEVTQGRYGHFANGDFEEDFMDINELLSNIALIEIWHARMLCSGSHTSQSSRVSVDDERVIRHIEYLLLRAPQQKPTRGNRNFL